MAAPADGGVSLEKAVKQMKESTPYMQNRELSWLRFNERVLLEALDESVPLLERLKFVSIFTSNLDEFFMIRVGSLWDLSLMKGGAVDNKTGLTAKEQLEAIFAAVQPLVQEKDDICRQLDGLLASYGICSLHPNEVDKGDQKYLRQYFSNEIEPILSPQIIDSHHPFPHLQNKVLHVGAWLQDKGKSVFGVIPVPPSLPEVLFLPGTDVRYVHTAELILSHAERVFKPYTVTEKTLFCITRNADITPTDEAFELDQDFRAQMKKLLRQRTKLAPVRLELSSNVSSRFTQYFCDKLQLSKKQLYVTSSPLQMKYVFSLPDRVSQALQQELTYPPFTPQPTAGLTPGESVLKQVMKRDVLLSYPYESMDPFLQMLREAARDPAVLSIKITIYRLARKAKLVDYLCAAAENGKDVTVMIELRARFDEQNNIDWSQRLEDAGCRILYGFDGYKVHSKICLITRRERNGIVYITQVGTGNYNENTAKQYTDLSYITANREIGGDANALFKDLAIGNLEGSYNQLLASPHTMKSRLSGLIDQEIAKGPKGRIFLKLNSVTDLELIQKLQEASQAGVQIRMIVRGICCILPQVEGKTDNIRVTSIVGRYLEHARIYCFGEGDQEIMYISSADFMTRNMDHRVEVACPIHSAQVRQKIHRMIEVQLMDNTKARAMRADGTYRRITTGRVPINSQEVLMNDALEAAAKATPAKKKPRKFWQQLFRKQAKEPM